MSIRIRGGLDSEFDKSKMVPRELVVLNSGKMFFCYSAGNVKQVATSEDLQEMLDSSATTYAALQQLIADLELNPSELTNILSNIASLQADKLDKTGNSQSNTVTFTEAVADADIATGDSHATLFGKILKRFNVITTALGSKQAVANMVQNDTTNDAAKYPSAAVVYQHGVEIDTVSNGLAKIKSGVTYANFVNGVGSFPLAGVTSASSGIVMNNQGNANYVIGVVFSANTVTVTMNNNASGVTGMQYIIFI